jgi:hypothetical protein
VADQPPCPHRDEDGRVINGRRVNEDSYTVQISDEDGRLRSR